MIISHILEENKADMGGIAFLDILQEAGYYNEEQKYQIIVTFIVDSFMREKPSLSQPHWVRSVMQNYYQFINGGYEIIDGKIRVNINNVVKNGIDMMDKIIQIQLENDYEKAKQYIVRGNRCINVTYDSTAGRKYPRDSPSCAFCEYKVNFLVIRLSIKSLFYFS